MSFAGPARPPEEYVRIRKPGQRLFFDLSGTLEIGERFFGVPKWEAKRAIQPPTLANPYTFAMTFDPCIAAFHQARFRERCDTICSLHICSPLELLWKADCGRRACRYFCRRTQVPSKASCETPRPSQLTCFPSPSDRFGMCQIRGLRLLVSYAVVCIPCGLPRLQSL